MAEAETEMPRSFSICMKSDRVRRASPLARTWPAIWIAPPNSRNFSVSVVLPASGCEMIAKVRRSRGRGDFGIGRGGADLDFTDPMPGSGSAVYRGHLGATAVLDGAAPTVVVGEVEMTALFASGTIGGTFRNLVSAEGDVSGSGVFGGGRFGATGIESALSGTLRRGGVEHAVAGTFRGVFLGAGAVGIGGGVEATLSRDAAQSGRLDGELWAER
jgi:hypothetical protein